MGKQKRMEFEEEWGKSSDKAKIKDNCDSVIEIN